MAAPVTSPMSAIDVTATLRRPAHSGAELGVEPGSALLSFGSLVPEPIGSSFPCCGASGKPGPIQSYTQPAKNHS